MAAAETAKLIASLELKDNLSKGIKSATGSLDKLDSKLGGIGATAKRGAGTAAKALAGIGVVAAGGLALAIKSGLDDLATLESAVTSVDGAIKQMGETGKVTGTEVAGWANDIEASIGAAFDDKAITAATATLIRFGKVTPSNLRPAMVVMTDLAAKTGSVDSAATLLAKALADPTKAAGKLSRAGVVLTKAEQDQIKAFVKAGKVGDAQKVVLDAIAKSTAGAAAASQGPYARALSTLRDVSEDARKALAEGFLPVIERVATLLSKALADPKTIGDIRNLGQGLAGAFDQAVTFAQKIPWGSIRDAMTLAGQGAKAALDLFTQMPDWVKTAVLTGWGLNKLTGGAVSGIIGELGKGLIKGVLGMNAGVVNINAGVVNGAGGGPGVSPGTVAAAGAGGTALGVTTLAAGIGGILTAYWLPQVLAAMDTRQRETSVTTAAGTLTPQQFAAALPTGALQRLATEAGSIKNYTQATSRDTDKLANSAVGQTRDTDKLDPQKPNAASKATKDAVAAVNAAKARAAAAAAAAQAALGAVRAAQGMTTGAVNSARSATSAGANEVAAAVRAARAIITTNVKVTVTAASVTRSVTVQSRYGSSGGSNASGANGTHRPGGPSGG